jgi:hypothetical protein
MLYDIHDAYGRYVTTYGQEGPVDFVSNLERQTVESVDTIRRRIAARAYGSAPASAIVDLSNANDNVLAALYDDSAPRLWVGAKDCLRYGRADAGWNDRSKYQMYCLPWQDNLTAATTRREAALSSLAAFSTQAAADAETDAALRDQTKTAEEQAKAVTNIDPKAQEGIPSWAKLALGAGVALFAARVLLPPLFGVYLRERSS